MPPGLALCEAPKFQGSVYMYRTSYYLQLGHVLKMNITLSLWLPFLPDIQEENEGDGLVQDNANFNAKQPLQASSKYTDEVSMADQSKGDNPREVKAMHNVQGDRPDQSKVSEGKEQLE